MKPATIKQCATCPWRLGVVLEEIPSYDPELHAALTSCIATDPLSSVIRPTRAMACHYSKPGEEFVCAGWLHHQIGVGNNVGVRRAVATGALPVPEVDGPQYERFEDTITN